MRILVLLILAGGLAAQSAQGQNQDRAPQKKETSKGVANQPNTASSENTTDQAEYKIGPQDLLKIDVWKEDQLTRTVPVRPDGKITLPLLNDVQAAGLTTMELSGIIREGLSKYINAPQVTVTVVEINSRRIYVTGEVVRAGAYPLLPNMTVLQALSTSGGFTQFARVKNIYVLRTEGGKQLKHPFNYKDAISGKKPEQNIVLQPGDVIVVP
jgi:polysaccharide export outer membrane protein